MKNAVLLTADDMSYGVMSCAGCEQATITPNIDRIARSGHFFTDAHCNIGVCQPSRQTLLTGLQPWNSGSFGFVPIHQNVTTLTEVLRRAGYFLGSYGKNYHMQPSNKFVWDMTHYKEARDDARCIAAFCEGFLKFEQRPFFLLLNSRHPHRPFGEMYCSPDSVRLPPCWPDSFTIREDMARYYAAVHKFDETVGAVWEVLERFGVFKDTVLVITSDHGMPFPLFKHNCYPFATRVPLIFYSPELRVCSNDNRVSHVDFLPTLLDLLGVRSPKTDGRSYKSLLYGNSTGKWDAVYTSYYRTSKGDEYAMKGVHTSKLCYVRNYWSDGNREFQVEWGNFRRLFDSFPKADSVRVDFILKKDSEELYDLSEDPWAMRNVIQDPRFAALKAQAVRLMNCDSAMFL